MRPSAWKVCCGTSADVKRRQAGSPCGLGGVQCQEDTLRTRPSAWVPSSCGARTLELSRAPADGSLSQSPRPEGGGGCCGIKPSGTNGAGQNPRRQSVPSNLLHREGRLREAQRLTGSHPGSSSSAEGRIGVSLLHPVQIPLAVPRKWGAEAEHPPTASSSPPCSRTEQGNRSSGDGAPLLRLAASGVNMGSREANRIVLFPKNTPSPAPRCHAHRTPPAARHLADKGSKAKRARALR